MIRPVIHAARAGAGRPGPRHYGALTLALFLPVFASVALAVEVWSPAAVLALALTAPCLGWLAGGAASALIGLMVPRGRRRQPPVDWQPEGRLAILVTLCGEEPVAAARRIGALARDLAGSGLARHCTLFILSDTPAAAAQPEARALAPLIEAGLVRYRRRPVNSGRKPGNIAEWYDSYARDYTQMLVLDADSRMSARRIRALLFRLETEPDIGLLQAGLAMVPAQSRFGQAQRVSSRLLGPGFARGFAAWTGDAANYWGHNAMIRTRAFAAALPLPALPGRAPLGGAILSHDIVEAALIRRAGWRVVLDPEAAGSLEDAPQTLAEYHRRDRRWCQGNLQHARLLAMPGLDAVSRLHLLSGIFGYLAGGVWLALLMFSAGGWLALHSVLPLGLIAALLLVPKAAGLWRLAGPGSTPWRRRIAWRAALGELAVSTLLAPVIMVQHTQAVLAVLAGYDCGWKAPERRRPLPAGWPEAGAGLALALLALAADPLRLVWLAPVIAPLLAAPVVGPMLDARPRKRQTPDPFGPGVRFVAGVPQNGLSGK